MNLLIDPAVLSEIGASSEETRDLLRKRLASLTVLIQKTGGRLVFTAELWRTFQRDLVSPIFSSVNDPAVRTPLQMLSSSVRIVPLAAEEDQVRAWGFEPLLNDAMGAGSYWADAYAALAASIFRAGEEVSVFTILVLNRNLRLHQTGHCQLHEKSRWRLYVGAPGLAGACHVPCVCNIRNVQIPWTARYDDRLPDTCPTSGVAFVAPQKWHRRSVLAFRTHLGKPCWLDGNSNYWADPSAPGSAYHWDVFFANSADSPLGISPVNVVRWGAPAAEGVGGDIHHIPTVKRSRVSS